MYGLVLFWFFVAIFITTDYILFIKASRKYEERHGELLWHYILIPGSGIYIWWKVRGIK